MVEKIKNKNLLKIPKLILERVGLNAGDYVEVSDDGYKIIITPKFSEESFTNDEWDKLAQLVSATKGKKAKTSKQIMRHLDKLSRK